MNEIGSGKSNIFSHLNNLLGKEIIMYDWVSLKMIVNHCVFVNESLTEREIQILELICDGKTNKEISDLISLSKRTIESHRRTISIKTGCGNVARLVVHAIKHGHYLIDESNAKNIRVIYE